MIDDSRLYYFPTSLSWCDQQNSKLINICQSTAYPSQLLLLIRDFFFLGGGGVWLAPQSTQITILLETDHGLLRVMPASVIFQFKNHYSLRYTTLINCLYIYVYEQQLLSRNNLCPGFKNFCNHRRQKWYIHLLRYKLLVHSTNVSLCKRKRYYLFPQSATVVHLALFH